MELSPLHEIPCSPSPGHDPTFLNDDGVASPMTTAWKNDDDDGDDDAVRIRTACVGGDNRIQIDVLQAWILL